MSLTLDKVIHDILVEYSTLSVEYSKDKRYELHLKNRVHLVQIRSENNTCNSVYYKGDLVYVGRTSDSIKFQQERFVPDEWTKKVTKKHLQPKQLKLFKY